VPLSLIMLWRLSRRPEPDAAAKRRAA
jgi:hypothetical protein